jgi:TPP-dependent pyruvate/acetoin dehydrogenase alpha subunit
LLELLTYRMRGHFEPDDQSYVDRHELASWRKRDPITALMQTVEHEGQLSPAETRSIEAAAKDLIEDAVAFAERSPYPELHELTTDVYA